MSTFDNLAMSSAMHCRRDSQSMYITSLTIMCVHARAQSPSLPSLASVRNVAITDVRRPAWAAMPEVGEIPMRFSSASVRLTGLSVLVQIGIDVYWY